jgi:hypothetical protein
MGLLVVRTWNGEEGGRYTKEVFFNKSCRNEGQESLWCRVLIAPRPKRTPFSEVVQYQKYCIVCQLLPIGPSSSRRSRAQSQRKWIAEVTALAPSVSRSLYLPLSLFLSLSL